MYALLLPAMLGMVGVVVDSGMIMAGHVQAQIAADAAVTAAAQSLLEGNSGSAASTTARTFVQQYNGQTSATVTVNIPPLRGNYAGTVNYAEAIVTIPVPTTFIQILPGISSTQNVSARAVAGFEPSVADGVNVLDPTIVPGLSVQGGGNLTVNGRITVNSPGKGLDQDGTTIDLGYPKSAATTGNGAVVKGKRVYVVGGVDVPSNFQPFLSGDPPPLYAGGLPKADPLTTLTVPQAGMAGVDTTLRGSVQLSSGTITLDPGIYDTIQLTGANATFNPGIYIIASTSNNALMITGSGAIVGNGVMFYNTGSDYTPSNPPDLNDGETPPPKVIAEPGNPTFGGITINGSNVTFSGLNNPSSPFNGLLLYQRRWNTQGINIQGSGGATSLNGTFYAKWAQFKLAGSATYGAKFVAGSMAIAGSANIILNAPLNPGGFQRIFLVE